VRGLGSADSKGLKVHKDSAKLRVFPGGPCAKSGGPTKTEKAAGGCRRQTLRKFTHDESS
jgi:hypothetical protein